MTTKFLYLMLKWECDNIANKVNPFDKSFP